MPPEANTICPSSYLAYGVLSSGASPVGPFADKMENGSMFMYITVLPFAGMLFGSLTHTMVSIDELVAFDSTHAGSAMPVALTPVVNATLLQLDIIFVKLELAMWSSS